MRTGRWASVAVVAAAGLLAPLITTGPAAAAGQSELAEVRAATAKYHNEKKAIAAGYVPTDECVPGMGYHYVNFKLFGAPVDPLKPAGLIYAPHGNGQRKLIGVEYFVIDEDQQVHTPNAVEPSLFGKAFDGPMPGHGDEGMPVHYDLHAYIWTTNPDGVLATWNPDVVCPAH